MRTWTLSVAAILLLAGCTAPETESMEANMAPDSTGHLLLQLAAIDPADVAVQVADDGGLGVLLPEQWHHNDTHAVAWIGFETPADASGVHQVVLDVTGARTDSVAIDVDVQAADGLGEGAAALVDLVLRGPNGTVAMNTRADVDASPLPQTADYQPPPQFAPQSLTLSSQQLPPEILEPLASLGEGQMATVEMEDFFGPAETEQEQPREESLDRRTTMPRFETVDRAMAEQQGLIDDSTQEGDRIPAGAFDYVVETLNDTTLRVEMDVQEGQSVTLHEAWPEATVVEAKGQADVVFRTDPPVEVGERFTWVPDWPGASEVAQVDDTAIVLRHSPDVGFTYTAQTQQGPVEQEVTAVRDDAIVVTQDNPHPLAGQTALLELTLVGEATPPTAGGAPPGP